MNQAISAACLYMNQQQRSSTGVVLLLFCANGLELLCPIFGFTNNLLWKIKNFQYYVHLNRMNVQRQPIMLRKAQGNTVEKSSFRWTSTKNQVSALQLELK